MPRYVYCEECRLKRGPMDNEDAANGWHQRITLLKAKKPDDLGIIVGSTFHPMPFVCDKCNAPIIEGNRAYAITMWQGDNEPPMWESEYTYE